MRPWLVLPFRLCSGYFYAKLVWNPDLRLLDLAPGASVFGSAVAEVRST